MTGRKSLSLSRFVGRKRIGYSQKRAGTPARPGHGGSSLFAPSEIKDGASNTTWTEVCERVRVEGEGEGESECAVPAVFSGVW